jgi:hydrogenase nickel incorporation protein HypA/HybF
MSIVEAVIDQIIERLGRTPVSLVRLEIGELSGVVPDAIRFCFDLAADGTTLAGAALKITTVAARCQCRACETAFRPTDQIRLCRCGSADVTVIAGDDLRIASVGVSKSV